MRYRIKNMEILALLALAFFLCAIPLFLGGVIVFFLARLGRGNLSKASAWQEVAAQLGLTYTPGTILKYPCAAGAWNGRAARLFATVVGTPGRGGSRTCTTITLSLNNSKNAAFHLLERNPLRHPSGLILNERAASENTRIGDEAFDQRFRVHCQPPEMARTIFSQAIRAHLLDAPPLQITLNANELRFQQRFIEADTARLLHLFEILRDLALSVENI